MFVSSVWSVLKLIYKLNQWSKFRGVLQTGWRFGERYKSKYFTNVLQKLCYDVLEENAIKNGLYESKEQVAGLKEIRLRKPLSFEGLKKIKGGYEITSELLNAYGDTKKEVMTIPRKDIRGGIFLANISYFVRDPSFSQYTFPYVIAVGAAVSIFCQILEYAYC